MRLPTQDNCNPDDPKEAFQWAFVALPFEGSTPFIVQPEAREEWSEMFHKLGFRHHPELQTHKIRPPWRGQQHALNATMEVVPVDEPDPTPVVVPDMSQYTLHEQAFVREQLRHLDRQGSDDTDKASVVQGELFNPSDHSVSFVLGYLMNASDAERRRVIAAEMTGKKRDGILRRYKGI
ncbi:phage gene 29 protein family protein [Nocardia cyriacigeorgica]|uniref:phage gene 29 protein family protein n=1 Tax=Nocardia cyriacigeorgica TaxID=135487 RepID=UPI00245455DF|nr:DUF2744 domain-containing protein [Nocardia cyriacigeorgica]